MRTVQSQNDGKTTTTKSTKPALTQMQINRCK